MKKKKEKQEILPNQSPAQPNQTSPAPIELSPEQASSKPGQLDRYQRLLDEYVEKWSHTVPIFGLRATRKKENSGVEIRATQELAWALLAKATGTIYWPLAKKLIIQAMQIIRPEKGQEQGTLEEILAAMLEIGPTDGLQGMLGVQIISAHALSIRHLRQAAKATHPEAQRHYQSLAEKAMNICRRQLEALNRHRGRGQPQRIVVERVTVSEGGQALIAGSVAPGAKGGGK